jgi:hypothetical protein
LEARGAQPFSLTETLAFINDVNILLTILAASLEVFAFKWDDLQRTQIDIVEAAYIDCDRVAAVLALATLKAPHSAVPINRGWMIRY